MSGLDARSGSGDLEGGRSEETVRGTVKATLLLFQLQQSRVLDMVIMSET
jgi:hypothetical protein